jgi:hypothetical protein
MAPIAGRRFAQTVSLLESGYEQTLHFLRSLVIYPCTKKVVAYAHDFASRNSWAAAGIRAGFRMGAVYLHDYLMRLPPPISWLWEGWKAFSHAFGRVMSFILLSILWVIGFGVYGCVLKLGTVFRKDEPEAQSFWIAAEPTESNHLLRQF